MSDIWKSFTIETGKCYFRQIGPLRLWLQFKNSEWLIASDRVPEEREKVTTEECSGAPETVSWCRFILPRNEKRVELVPVPPDRSIVVRPESELKIASDAHALFFVLIPVWVRVTIGIQNTFTLTELPSQIMSNTWFGEPHEGEHCYFLKTWARRSFESLTPRPHWTVCPVYVKNTSSADLDFKRLCIRTGFLNIYKGASWLWTNKVYVHFRGASQTSKIRYDTDIPDFEATSKLIGKSRLKPVKEFSIKSFDTFNIFAGG